MQDNVSVPGMPLAAGLTIESLTSHTVDEKGNKAFVTHNPLELLRKVCTPKCLWQHVLVCLLACLPFILLGKGVSSYLNRPVAADQSASIC